MAGLDIRGVLGEAVRLHQTGQLQQAAALYRHVLTVDPCNADALHLLGMVALQQGEAETASDLIARAIAQNNREASYHFHHALARQTLNDLQGAVTGYRRALALKPNDPDTYNNMGNALAAQGKREEAVAAFRRVLALQPGNAVAHNNLGHVQRSMRLWDEAETSFLKAAELQPGFAGAFVNLGNLHRDKEDLQKAESSYRHAVRLAPRDPATHCGLGLALWQLGNPDEALASYRTALTLDPAHPETLVNLAIARGEAGALEEAEALYARALAVRPQDPDILNLLASLRLARNDNADAMAMIRQSLAVRETPEAKKLFVEAVRRSDGTADAQLRATLVRALTEPWGRPAVLAPACGRLIRSDSTIGPLVAAAGAAWPGRQTLAQLLGDRGIAPLAENEVLIALLTSTPNTDIALERFLTLLRGAMMREMPHDPGAQSLAFAAALAQQCFINDYVFLPEPDTLAAAGELAKRTDTATAMQLMLVASYIPLHTLAHAERLLDRSWPAAADAVLTQQVREPLRERQLRAGIPRLTGIESPVSRLVQNQYEENPYPRWVRPAPETPDTIGNFLCSKFPFAQIERAAGSAPGNILIAGCGTGQRSIAMAQKFGSHPILAVDLSLASLGYARRKSEALGLAITYAQADILELEAGEHQFDLIESLGVLHHLADPWAGWRKLLSLLRPGGFMLLGLYSATARRPIQEVRAGLAAHDGGADDIRTIRQALIANGAHASIVESEDFFSLSGCRDLLFHVQERHVRLPEIARFIQDHELRLLGLELDGAILAAYRNRFPQDRAATDLACWEAFEADHPRLFGGMYVFWVQKSGGKAGN